MKNAKDTQQRPRQNRCITATPIQKNTAPPLPNRQIFVPPPGHQATNRQNSNDFRTKKHNEIKHIKELVEPIHKLLVTQRLSYMHAQSE